MLLKHGAPPACPARWKPNVRRVGAAPAAGAHAATAGPGAGAELGPGAPATILAVQLLRRLPDAVTLEAPLEERRKRGGSVSEEEQRQAGPLIPSVTPYF